MRVTLLGTGCPLADPYRYGPATLVETGSESWLIDCGSGVTQRLLAHGTNGAAITGLLLTHLHSDHTVDFMQLLISGWHQGRQGPLRVYGPRRTKAFLEQLLAAWEPEFAQRSAHEVRPRDGLAVEITEIDGTWLHQTDEVVITNTEVNHKPIPQAFGFRFDAGGASTVVSGDTAYCPELIDMAIGADLLVHECYVHREVERSRGNRPEEGKRNVRAYHTDADEVGQAAKEAAAHSLALTHFVPPWFDPAEVEADVRRHFDGPLYIGADLMSLDVQRAEVTLVNKGVEDVTPPPR